MHGSRNHEEVIKERRQTREAPGPHFDRVSRVWSALLNHPVTPVEVCLMMASLKIVREIGGHDPDNIVDGMGYLELAREVYYYSTSPVSYGPEDGPAMARGRGI
jgi:Domain of unknown function (DUF6378)